MSLGPRPVTAQELALLALLAEGFTMASAATRLNPPVSCSAAEARAERARAKLGACTSAQAVWEAYCRGLLQAQVAPDPCPLLRPVLRLMLQFALCQGLTCRQVAKLTGYTAKTVENYVAHACRTLGAVNRAAAVRAAIYTGDLVFPPGAAAAQPPTPHRRGHPMTASEYLSGKPLTAREVQVLAATARGGSCTEIGKRLIPALASATVRTHLVRIRAKLGARTICQAIYQAYTDGWLLRPDRMPAPRLRPVELQVMQMLVQGKTVDQIAEAMKLTPSALKYRLKLAHRCLGASNRLQAVHCAVALGDLPVPPHQVPLTPDPGSPVSPHAAPRGGGRR